MSHELLDLRTKVSVTCNALLEGRARTEERDKADVVREILHAWAEHQVGMVKIADRIVKSEGMKGILGE